MNRVYRFFNMEADRYGEPFTLCDKHRETQKVPDSCILTKLADDSTRECERCGEADE